MITKAKPKQLQLTPVATRRMSHRSGRELRVKIGKPRRVRPDEWRCSYCIEGLGRANIQEVCGADGVQALLLCFEAIRTRLTPMGDDLAWECGEPGDSGFPRYIPSIYGIKFYKRLERLIDREVDGFARRAKARYQRR